MTCFVHPLCECQSEMRKLENEIARLKDGQVKVRNETIEECADIAEKHHVGGLTAFNIAGKIRCLNIYEVKP